MWCPSLGHMLPWTKRAKGGVPLWMFLTLSLYVAIPFSHWVYMNGGLNNPLVLVWRIADTSRTQLYRLKWWSCFQLRIKSMVIPFMIGGVGLCFYVSRFPENLLQFNGCFDLFGASHQVWHVMIFLGMFYWYYESVTFFTTFQGDSCST